MSTGSTAPVVYPKMAEQPEDVAKIAPEAGHLMSAALPYLTLAQADDILAATEGPGGGFLVSDRLLAFTRA
jgi:hypothetical protein